MSTKLCPPCGIQVSVKLWTAHVTGRKHKIKVSEAKKVAPAEKRPSTALNDHPGAKKPRIDASAAGEESGATTSAPAVVNEFQFIPSGFFDNAEKDNRSTDTQAKQKAFDDEYAKLMNEISAAEQAATAVEDADTETFNHERQLEDIDETMGYWKSLNELEKRKEEIDRLRQAAAEARARGVEDDEAEDAEADDDDGEEIDVSLDGDNWRSRGI